MLPGVIALITLILTIVWGVIKYFNNDKTKLRNLKARQYDLEEKLRGALARRDTVVISSISLDLDRLRRQIADINTK